MMCWNAMTWVWRHLILTLLCFEAAVRSVLGLGYGLGWSQSNL